MTVRTSTDPGSRPSGKENDGEDVVCCIEASVESSTSMARFAVWLSRSLVVDDEVAIDDVAEDVEGFEVISQTAALSRPFPCSGRGYIGFA